MLLRMSPRVVGIKFNLSNVLHIVTVRASHENTLVIQKQRMSDTDLAVIKYGSNFINHHRKTPPFHNLDLRVLAAESQEMIHEIIYRHWSLNI